MKSIVVLGNSVTKNVPGVLSFGENDVPERSQRCRQFVASGGGGRVCCDFCAVIMALEGNY